MSKVLIEMERAKKDFRRMLIMSPKELLNMDINTISTYNKRRRVLMLLYLYLHCGSDEIGTNEINDILFDELINVIGHEMFEQWTSVIIYEKGFEDRIDSFLDGK